MAKLTARQIIDGAARAGVTLTVEGEAVRITPLSSAPDWLVEAVRSNLAGIVRELKKPVVRRVVTREAPHPDGPMTGVNIFDRLGSRSGW